MDPGGLDNRGELIVKVRTEQNGGATFQVELLAVSGVIDKRQHRGLRWKWILHTA